MKPISFATGFESDFKNLGVCIFFLPGAQSSAETGFNFDHTTFKTISINSTHLPLSIFIHGPPGSPVGLVTGIPRLGFSTLYPYLHDVSWNPRYINYKNYYYYYTTVCKIMWNSCHSFSPSKTRNFNFKRGGEWGPGVAAAAIAPCLGSHSPALIHPLSFSQSHSPAPFIHSQSSTLIPHLLFSCSLIPLLP